MDRAFIQAVNDNNLLRVRLLLTNELLLDPRGESFDEMLLFAQTNIPNLFEVNTEANYSIPPQNNWDMNFLFTVKNDLDNNFSKEKITFYKTVIKNVCKEKVERLTQEDKIAREKQQDGYGQDKAEKMDERIYSLGRAKLIISDETISLIIKR